MPERVYTEVQSVMVQVDLTGTDSIGPWAGDPRDLQLADPHHFAMTVDVYVGQSDQVGSDSFRMTVCSPSWFAARAHDDGFWGALAASQGNADQRDVVVGTGLWFMRRWDADQLLSTVDAVCAAANGGPTFQIVASRIGRYIPWEFDYRYDEDVDAGSDV